VRNRVKRYIAVLLFAIFSVWMSAGIAQETGSGNQGQGNQAQQHRGEHKGADPQKRVQHLTKKLNLSSDQQAKVLTILQDQQKQRENLRNDSSLSQQDRRSKMMDLHKSANEQIRALLTPDQQKKFDQMEQKKAARHHGGRNDNQPQTPPQS